MTGPVEFIVITPNPRPKKCPKWWDNFGISVDREVFAASGLLGSDAFLCSLFDGGKSVTLQGKIYLSLDWAIAPYGDLAFKAQCVRLRDKVLAEYDKLELPGADSD